MWIFTWVFDWVFDRGRCPHSGVHHGVLARKCYVADGPKGDDWMFWTGCAMPVIFLFALGVRGLPLVGPGISRPGPGFVEDIPRTEGFLDTQLRWNLLLFSSNYLAVGVSPSKRLVCLFSVSAQPRKAQLCGLEMETSYVWILVQILMVYWPLDFQHGQTVGWQAEVVRLCSRNDVGSSKDHTSVFRNLADPNKHILHQDLSAITGLGCLLLLCDRVSLVQNFLELSYSRSHQKTQNTRNLI